jgi:hypothetical protein
MGAVLATIAAGEHNICHQHRVATNKLITPLNNYILINHSIMALANTLDGLTLCWIERTH